MVFFLEKKIIPNADIASLLNYIVIGAISGFKYIEGKTEKSKQYSLDFAPVKKPRNNVCENANQGINVSGENTTAGENKGRGINVSGTWYVCDDDLKLRPMNNCHYFIDINNYIATISPRIFKASLNEYEIVSDINALKEQIHKLICQ